MRDVRATVLIAVPAALTILGVLWFLCKKSNKEGERKKKKKEESPPPIKVKSGEDADQYRFSQPDWLEKEGITLTQRKIPDAAAQSQPKKSDVLSQSADQTSLVVDGDENDQRPLTEGEKEKVKEIVEAAIGASLKKVQADNVNKNSAEMRETAVEEEMVATSVAAVTQGIQNPRDSAQDVAGNNNASQVTETVEFKYSEFFNNNSCNLGYEGCGDSSLESSFVNKVTPASSPCQIRPTEKLSLGADSTSVQVSECLVTSRDKEGEKPVAVVCDRLSDVPSSTDTSSSRIEPCEEAVMSSCTYSSNLSCSVLASSSFPSDSGVSVTDVIPCQASVPDLMSVESVSSESESKVSHSSTDTQDKKAEESSASSSSPNCDNNSVGSNDSGRGGSEHETLSQMNHRDALIYYNFNMPSELSGKLIGRQGKNIKLIKSKSGARVSLQNNPLSPQFQICEVVGSQAEVDKALSLIRRKFPLEDHPLLTMQPVTLSLPPALDSSAGFLVPDTMQLSLPDGASVEVYMSTIVDCGHVFVQQPTHRSFMCLEKLNYFLQTVYSQDDSIPPIPTPVECGVICVCENEGMWYRTMVMTPEDGYGECQVKFVDYGGYAQLPITRLKQIRADFMNLPFQAVECFMANIAPLQGEDYFSPESTLSLSEMAQLKVLQCQVVARNEVGTPYIHLYSLQPQASTATLVNRALVNEGLVRWVEIL